jgi:hypothetical protein
VPGGPGVATARAVTAAAGGVVESTSFNGGDARLSALPHGGGRQPAAARSSTHGQARPATAPSAVSRKWSQRATLRAEGALGDRLADTSEAARPRRRGDGDGRLSGRRRTSRGAGDAAERGGEGDGGSVHVLLPVTALVIAASGLPLLARERQGRRMGQAMRVGECPASSEPPEPPEPSGPSGPSGPPELSEPRDAPEHARHPEPPGHAELRDPRAHPEPVERAAAREQPEPAEHPKLSDLPEFPKVPQPRQAWAA